MRSDQYLITLAVDGAPLGVWDSLTGGDTSTAEVKYRPGGMSPEKTLPGPTSVSNIVVAREFDPGRGDDLIKRTLRDRCGKGLAVVTRQPLDGNGNPWGSPEVYTGLVQTVAPGNVDSNASNIDMLTVTISTEGSVA